MKKIKILLLVVIAVGTVNAQLYKFPQTGFKQGEYYNSNGIGYSKYLDFSFAYIKDSLMGSFTYSKFKFSTGGNFFTRYDKGKVFLSKVIGDPQKDRLLYDFSLSKYGTINLDSSGVSFGSYYYVGGVYMVDSVSMVTCSNGQKRKYLRLQSVNSGTAPQIQTLHWIDAIGDINNGFFHEANSGYDTWGFEAFVCSHDSSGLVFGNSNKYYNCDSMYFLGDSKVIPTIKNVSCNGLTDGSIALTPSGGCNPFTYSWSIGSTNPSLTGLGIGQYTVTVTDCSGNTGTLSVLITEPPVLSVTAFASAATSGMNNGFAYVNVSGGTPGYTYQWSNGENGGSNFYLACGTYSITLTDANGCTATDTAKVACVTGIRNLVNGNYNLTVSPNPNHGIFNLNIIDSKSTTLSIKIYDPLGQLIYADVVSAGSYESNKQIDLNKQPPGIYSIQVLGEQGIVTRKVIISP